MAEHSSNVVAALRASREGQGKLLSCPQMGRITGGGQDGIPVPAVLETVPGL